jgi:hypothetical protein
MAMAARYFKPYDPNYAQDCLDAAEKSYTFLTANPKSKGFVQGSFQTGGYQTGDSDDRVWAAAEMWETTGRAECLRDFETRAAVGSSKKIDENWDWGSVRNLGMFTYVLSQQEGRDPNLVERIRRDVVAIADALVAKAKQDVYGRPLSGRYYWGCNGTVARQVLNLQVANKISPKPEYQNTVLDAIAHLFGRNYYGRSYVTGLGRQPPMNPHDRRSGADGIKAPWPGYSSEVVTLPRLTDTQADYDQRNRYQLAGGAGLRPGRLCQHPGARQKTGCAKQSTPCVSQSLTSYWGGGPSGGGLSGAGHRRSHQAGVPPLMSSRPVIPRPTGSVEIHPITGFASSTWVRVAIAQMLYSLPEVMLPSAELLGREDGSPRLDKVPTLGLIFSVNSIQSARVASNCLISVSFAC